MPKKRQEKRERKRLAGCEHRSDRRTAEFIVRRLSEVQGDLSDLVTEFRTFDHFSEMEDATWCLRVLQSLKKKYTAFADDGVWPEDK